MADSSYNIRDTVTQQDRTVKLKDNGDGTYSLATVLTSALIATIDSITAKPATDVLISGNSELPVKTAIISVSSSGVTQLVAAVSGKKIKVINFLYMCAAPVNVKFQSHVTPTDKTGPMPNAANTGAAPGEAEHGHFSTIAGEALDINLSAAVAVGGYLTYVEE